MSLNLHQTTNAPQWKDVSYSKVFVDYYIGFQLWKFHLQNFNQNKHRISTLKPFQQLHVTINHPFFNLRLLPAFSLTFNRQIHIDVSRVKPRGTQITYFNIPSANSVSLSPAVDAIVTKNTR